MLVLALDTTTRRSSAALIDRSGAAHVVALADGDPVVTRLPADLGRLVADAGEQLAGIDALAVAVGPGSFTGLRIGIAAMQGLAFALRRPLIGISGLDALALTARGSGAGNVITWVDAWRGEVYAARYRAGEPGSAPTVDRPEHLLGELPAGEAWTFIGDGAAAFSEAIAGASSLFELAPEPMPLLAEPVARLALTELAAAQQAPSRATGDAGAPGAIRPLYVRRPDAERIRSAQRGLGVPRA